MLDKGPSKVNTTYHTGALIACTNTHAHMHACTHARTHTHTQHTSFTEILTSCVISGSVEHGGRKVSFSSTHFSASVTFTLDHDTLLAQDASHILNCTGCTGWWTKEPSQKQSSGVRIRQGLIDPSSLSRFMKCEGGEFSFKQRLSKVNILQSGRRGTTVH